MSTAFEIRDAVVGDATGIATVHVLSWQAAYKGLLPDDYLALLSVEKRTASWKRHVTDEQCSTLVAVRDDQIIGFSNFGPSRDDDADATVGEVNAIYLIPIHWNRGVGRELWLRSLDSLTTAGLRTLTLWVLDTNERARRFYERAGFVADGKTKVDTRDGGVELREIRYARSCR